MDAFLFASASLHEGMSDLWDKGVAWFLSLGEQYGVDPIIFGSIYVGAIPLFTLSVAWLIRSKRKEKPLTLPAVSAGFWFISSYLYVFIAGENIPWWVYGAVVVFLVYAGYASFRNIQSKITRGDSPN